MSDSETPGRIASPPQAHRGTVPVGTGENAAPLVRFSSDRAIESGEQDLLGRRPFATAMADALVGWTGRDSLIVALSGPWGSGKSSVKNMVLEHLGTVTPERRPDVVRFSPWQWSWSDQLAAGFFRELGIALGTGDAKKRHERLAVAWASYAATFNAGGFFGASAAAVARYALGLLALLTLLGVLTPISWLRVTLLTLAGVTGLVAGLLKWGGQAAEHLASVFAAQARRATRSADQMKLELADLLSQRTRPLLVVVDDVDRLAASEIPVLFQLVKAHGDFPNVIYLLLYQKDLVEKALDAVAPGGDGVGYLEKIVQVPFTLPPVERSRLDKLLFAGLNSTLGSSVEHRFDSKRWGNLYLGGLRSYFRTPRDVHRFLNTLAFHVSVFRGSGTLEVNPVDLIALEVLRVFDHSVYRSIAASKELLTNEPTMGASSAREAAHEAIMALADLASDEHRKEMRYLIGELFPLSAWAFDGIHTQTNGEWFRALRVAHADVFDRYFLLATPEGDISQAELESLISRAGDREALTVALMGLRTRGMLAVALDRLDSYKEHISLEHAVPLAAALYDVGDDLEDTPDGFLGMSADTFASRIVHWNLRQEPDASKRARLLEQAIRQTRGLYLPVRQVAIDEGEEGRPRQADRRLLDDEDLRKMRGVCVERLVAAGSDGSLARQKHLAYLLFRWREWAGDQDPAAYARELAATSEGTLQLLKGFVTVQTSFGIGDRTVQKIHFIRASDLKHFVPLDEIEQHVEALPEDTLTEDQRNTVTAFKRGMAQSARGDGDADGDEP